MPEMTGLQPVIDLNGNNNCGVGNWGGALIGGAIGGAVGSAWNRGGNWNNGGCCNPCCGNNGDRYLMDTLTTMRTDVDSIGRDQLMQVANLGGQLCEGFGRSIASMQNIGAQIAQGQSRTEAAVLTTGLQNQISQKDNVISQLGATHQNEVQSLRNTFDIVSSQKDCCCSTKQLISECCCETNRNIERQGCETRTAIHAEGEATRALISKYAYEALQEKLCDAKAENAALKSQAFSTNLAAGTAQQTRNDMNAMLTTILTHIAAKSSSTGTSQPA